MDSELNHVFCSIFAHAQIAASVLGIAAVGDSAATAFAVLTVAVSAALRICIRLGISLEKPFRFTAG